MKAATIVTMLGIFILGAILSLSLVGCNKVDDTIGVTNSELVPKGGIPAIDLSVLARTETATFALG